MKKITILIFSLILIILSIPSAYAVYKNYLEHSHTTISLFNEDRLTTAYLYNRVHLVNNLGQVSDEINDNKQQTISSDNIFEIDNKYYVGFLHIFVISTFDETEYEYFKLKIKNIKTNPDTEVFSLFNYSDSNDYQITSNDLNGKLNNDGEVTTHEGFRIVLPLEHIFDGIEFMIPILVLQEVKELKPTYTLSFDLDVCLYATLEETNWQ